MDEGSPQTGRSRPPRESYARAVAGPVGILAILIGLGAWQFREPPKADPKPAQPDTPPVVVPSPTPPPVVALAPSVPKPKKKAAAAPPAPVLDLAAVAKAEAAVDAASRDRGRAEARLADAQHALQAATLQLASDEAEVKALGEHIKDPAPRISAATAKGGYLRGERDRLKAELASLARVPVPRSKALMAKSAVAKPTDGEEFHFEVRRDRVSFIDLDKLIELVKDDARLRLRVGGGRSRLAASVGPVGWFALRYEMGRGLPEGMGDPREATYMLRGWEVVPETPDRGETLEETRARTSNYARAISRLNPGHDTVTMWIYPDGFALYRRLRDDLHARGFLVAARPLPEGTSIKGSPVGSVSAGQ
jgi:hypothetical protein